MCQGLNGLTLSVFVAALQRHPADRVARIRAAPGRRRDQLRPPAAPQGQGARQHSTPHIIVVLSVSRVACPRLVGRGRACRWTEGGASDVAGDIGVNGLLCFPCIVRPGLVEPQQGPAAEQGDRQGGRGRLHGYVPGPSVMHPPSRTHAPP